MSTWSTRERASERAGHHLAYERACDHGEAAVLWPWRGATPGRRRPHRDAQTRHVYMLVVKKLSRVTEAEMGRRHPLTPAEAMPRAMPAWPQALPRGPCDAQPRIYHGPSDFRLWAPSGSTARARYARLLAQALACCLHARRPAFRPLDEGLRGPEETRGGLRPRNSEKSNRATALF